MSFQNKNDQELAKSINTDISLSGFEKHIINCCKAPEWMLRKKLKKFLQRAGFTVIIEDGYKSDRVNKDKRYSTVHNLLAIRGNPKICLASHTDICRDHTEARSSQDPYGKYGEQHYWMHDGHEKNMPRQPRQVEPVLKVLEDSEGVMRRIITDRENKLQVGGDDRLGVAINTWIAVNTRYDMAIYLPTDEEIGLKSAAACEIQELKQFDLIAEVDRGNHSDQLVIKIGGDVLCDYETTVRLLSIAHKIGRPREVVCGMGTDVAALKRRGFAKNAVNMTCGYHNSNGDSANEYIDVVEAESTMKFVASIVKDYNRIETVVPNITTQEETTSTIEESEVEADESETEVEETAIATS